jgi:hypothetical protein
MIATNLVPICNVHCREWRAALLSRIPRCHGGAIHVLFRAFDPSLTRPTEEINVCGASASGANELKARAMRQLDVLGDEEMLLLDPFAHFFCR